MLPPSFGPCPAFGRSCPDKIPLHIRQPTKYGNHQPSGASASTLQKYIVKNKLYSITFTNPKYMYFMGNCFEDTSGVSEADALIQLLEVLPTLSGAAAEKGIVKTVSTAFDEDSVFGIVESQHAADDYIFCDDLGIEWADHIILNELKSTITFVHSKHGDPSVSASKMHDVVGQGIKNLGNMFFQDKDLKHKCINKFNELYASSQITRVRKGDMSKIDQCINSITKDYRALRKCILCCSFLSKADIKAEFDKIKSGQAVSGNVIQLFWIISSFAHAAKEVNVQPVIYCQP